MAQPKTRFRYMTQLYSTRVRAPNNNISTHLVTSAASTVTGYDGTTLNPLHPGGVGPDSTVSTDAIRSITATGAASRSSLSVDSAASGDVKDHKAQVESSPRFIGRGKPFQISTFNTRTLNPISRLHELVHAASLHNNDIICIQEHRHYHQSVLSYQILEKHHFITASATKNSCNATVGGVGFLISPRAHKSLLSVEKINSRIILLHLDGNPKLTVISAYAPTNCSDPSDKSSFYASLNRTVSSVPPHNLLAIGGDFNAKLCPKIAPHTQHPSPSHQRQR